MATGFLPIATPSAEQNFAMDALGNMAADPADENTLREYDSRNALAQNGSDTLSYDAAGHVTADGIGRTMTYDAWGRLAGVYDDEEVALAAYSYDGLSRRVVEIEDPDSETPLVPCHRSCEE